MMQKLWNGLLAWLGQGPASPEPGAPRAAMPHVADSSSRQNMILLIQLRWIAVAGQVVTITLVHNALAIKLPLAAMSIGLGIVVLVNIATLVWVRRRAEIGAPGLLLAMLFDVAALTAQLYLSGGATNPFVFLYIVQVTLAAVLLRTRPTLIVVVFTSLCFAGLALFNRPLLLPADGRYDLFQLHISGMLVCFALDAALLVVFVTRINRNLRARDAHLAALRQHAVEEDHIVRMGLLASGAAHELGTPLASLSVILGDWRHLPAISGDPDMAQELAEMQAAVQRCKSILTGILISAGEARGEAPAATTVNRFLTDLVRDWRTARSVTTLHYANSVDADVAIVSDTALEQVMFNVLDNAYEASPSWLSFTAERQGDSLVLRVTDAGPGFGEQMLEQLGKPYQSSKGRPGGGLGLFLVVNVVRKLGGTVSARNRATGGAVVSIELPLERLTIEQESENGR